MSLCLSVRASASPPSIRIRCSWADPVRSDKKYSEAESAAQRGPASPAGRRSAAAAASCRRRRLSTGHSGGVPRAGPWAQPRRRPSARPGDIGLRRLCAVHDELRSQQWWVQAHGDAPFRRQHVVRHHPPKRGTRPDKRRASARGIAHRADGQAVGRHGQVPVRTAAWAAGGSPARCRTFGPDVAWPFPPGQRGGGKAQAKLIDRRRQREHDLRALVGRGDHAVHVRQRAGHDEVRQIVVRPRHSFITEWGSTFGPPNPEPATTFLSPR